MKTVLQELIQKIELQIEEEKIEGKFGIGIWGLHQAKNLVMDMLEKEKEQIIDAGNGGVLINFLHREKLAKMSDDELRDSLVENTISYGEQYYNQTYNQNK